MNIERRGQCEAIFHELADRSLAEQQALLEGLCSGDQDLMADVSRLLKEDARQASILNRDIADIAANLLEPEPSLRFRDFGPYEIKSVLGQGGMGVVYLAERRDIGGHVAIKVLRDAPLSPWRRERFAREETTLAKLSHPFIARLFEAKIFDDGTPWFVMEYVEGRHLTDYCREHSYSIRQRLELFRSVCEAVQYAHGQGVIHRDVKPSNILVENSGTAKLLDFGIALQLERLEDPAGRTRTGLGFMTPLYTAPERIRGERGGVQSDVYSLGVILYELLTDKLPFDLANQTPGQMEITVTERPVVPPSAMFRRQERTDPSKPVWSDLDVLCLTAMHRDQERRYQSVEALGRDIDRYLKSQPLEARSDTVLYRLSKFAARNRKPLWATAVALAIVLIMGTSFVARLTRERRTELADEARTQKIQRFMLSLFDGGDHDVGPAAGLRVATILNRGVHEAQTLNGEPQTQAALLETLGNIYLNLEQFDRAEPLLRSAYERSKAAFGPNSREFAETMLDLGLVRLQQGQPREAETLIREGLALDERELPAKDPAITKGMLELGIVKLWTGSFPEAVKILNQTVQHSKLHDMVPDSADAVSALAVAHYYVGDYAVSESLDRQALAMHQRLYGSIHPKIADDFYNLGTVQKDLGQLAAAEQYFRKSLAIKESWYGDNNPDTAMCMLAVAKALTAEKRYEEASTIAQRAVGIQERLLGNQNPRVAMGLNMIANLDLARDRLGEAEANFQRMEAINRATYGDGNYFVGAAMLGLGDVYSRRKEYALAEQSYRGALERFTPAHRDIWKAQQRLGTIFVAERQYRKAEPYLVAAHDELAKHAERSQTEALGQIRQDMMTVYEALGNPSAANKIRVEIADSRHNGQ